MKKDEHDIHINISHAPGVAFYRVVIGRRPKYDPRILSEVPTFLKMNILDKKKDYFS